MTVLHDLVVLIWPRLPFPGWLRAVIVWLLRPKFIVGVEALIVDDAGRCLLGRHSYRSHRPWGPLGGAVDRNESLADALRREVREESGLEVAVGPVVAIVRGIFPRRIDVVFRCQVIAGSLTPSTEITAFRWCEPEELDLLLAAEDRWFAELARRPAGEPTRHELVIR